MADYNRFSIDKVLDYVKSLKKEKKKKKKLKNNHKTDK